MPERAVAGSWSWGHHASTLTVTLIALSIGLDVGRPALPAGPAALAGLALLAALGVALLALVAHNRRLCEACVRRLPLDCEAAAARRLRRLWLVHLMTERRWLSVGYLLVIVVAAVAVPGPLGVAMLVGCKVFACYLVLSIASHRMLQPWCPWCRGGDHDLDRAPDPVPGGSRLG